MNKRGIIWETLSDVFLAGFILFIGLTLFFLITGDHQKKVDTYFSQKTVNLNNDMIFLSYLSSGGLHEQITRSYFSEDMAALEEGIDAFLEKTYLSKMCWSLYRDDEKWTEKNKCMKKENVLNSSVFMPLPGHETIKVSLYVNGYAEEETA